MLFIKLQITFSSFLAATTTANLAFSLEYGNIFLKNHPAIPNIKYKIINKAIIENKMEKIKLIISK